MSKLFKNFLLQFLFVWVLASSAFAQAGTNTIDAGAKLLEGQRLISANNSYYLTMQADGNLCIYTSSNQFVWCSMLYLGKGSYLIMQADGDLVVYDGNNNQVWNTMTQAFYDSKYATTEWKAVRAVLDDNGTLSLYTAANKKVWSSNDQPAQPIVSPGVGFTGPTVKKDLSIQLPGSDKASNITVEITNTGEVFFQSDMKLGTVASLAKQANAPPKPEDAWKWLNSTVPYVLPANHKRFSFIQEAIGFLNDYSTICLVPRTDQKDYVEFIDRQGNWSEGGRRGGKQVISVENDDTRTVFHEIMHALGLIHIHTREDRDTYVTINLDNIEEKYQYAFKIFPYKKFNIGDYDYASVMHYPSDAFAKVKGVNTITRRDGIKEMGRGRLDGMSETDVKLIAALYPACPGKIVKPFPTTTTKPTTTTTKPPPTAVTKPTTTTTKPTTAVTNPATCEGKDAVEKYPALFMKLGDILQENEKLMSANGRFQLRGTLDGNFIIEESKGSGNCPFTEIYRFPLPNSGDKPAISFLRYGADGNVCVVSKQGKYYCATYGNDEVAPIILNQSVKLELTDDGRLILVNSNGQEIWATSKKPTSPKGPEPTLPSTSGAENLPAEVLLYMANDADESYDVILERDGKVIAKYFIPGKNDKLETWVNAIISESHNIPKMNWRVSLTGSGKVQTACRYGDVLKANKIGVAEVKQFVIDRTIGGSISYGFQQMNFYPNRGLSGK